MNSPTTTDPTTPTTTAATTPASTPLMSHLGDEKNELPDRTQVPVSTNDFYLDTYFSPIWMSGPHVFSLSEDGIVVRPETYTPEPYPGYHAHAHVRPPRRLESISVSHLQGFSARDEKPWKNVAITEQDDAEFAAIQGGLITAEERGSFRCASPDGTPLELVYTWPPTPEG